MSSSFAQLPMFFEPRHERVAAAIEACVGRDEDARSWRSPKGVAGALAESGLFSFVVPREEENVLDVRGLCLVRERLAGWSPLADAILAVQGLCAQAIVLSGDRAAHAGVLGDLRAGRAIGAFALTEPEAGSDVANLGAAAEKSGDRWLVTGRKVFISNAGMAGVYVVFANADSAAGKRGISAFLVDGTAPELTVEPIATSGDHPLGAVTLRACPAVMLGKLGQGLKIALGTLDVLRTSVGAAAVGMAQAALDLAVAHVKERTQFGKKLAEFQLTQAAVADCATELDAARLLVYRAAWAKDRGAAGKTEVAMAKMYATEAAQRIIDRAVQLFGGRGVVRASFVEHLYREIRPLRIYEGTTEIQKLIIGGALLEDRA